MKCLFLIFIFLVSICVKAQQEESTDTTNRDVDKYCFPNTNIEKSSLVLFGGLGLIPYTGNLTNYFEPNLGGAMSLEYHHYNNLTFSLTIMGTDSHLKEDVNINNNLWTPKDTIGFWSYGLTVGYSVINEVHWSINSFGGIVLSQLKFTSPNGYKYKTAAKPSPVFGLNFSYRFINVKKEMQRISEHRGASSGLGINARITYVPLAVNNKEIPFSGGICYTTLGINFYLF
jgi:hypothetical protein